MAQITTNTSTEEIQSIYDYYQNDFNKIAAAIASDDSKFDTDDLITAYVQGTNQLPGFMPDAILEGPEKFPQLWEDNTVKSLQELGDLYQGKDLAAQIQNFLKAETDYKNSQQKKNTEKKPSLLDEVQAFLDGQDLSDVSDPDEAKKVFDLFAPGDLKDVMSLFMKMGNIGMVLLLYTAYGANEAKKELQSAALDVLSDLNDQKEDLLGQLQDLDPEDPQASYESQVISQQLQTITTVISTMLEFIKTAQEMVNKPLEMSSALKEGSDRVDSAIIHNMA